MIKGLVMGKELLPQAARALGELVQASVQWLPSVPTAFRGSPGSTRRNAITLQWAIASREPVSVAAAYLSLIHGQRGGLLRSCTRCEDPFLAVDRRGRPDRSRRTCDVCRVAGNLSPGQQRIFKRILNRERGHYRKWNPGKKKWDMSPEDRARWAERRRQLQEDLLRLGFGKWVKEHGPEKAPAGRPRRPKGRGQP